MLIVISSVDVDDDDDGVGDVELVCSGGGVLTKRWKCEEMTSG